MANYTGLSDLKNHVHRTGFDISQKCPFTAKVGEILPVYWDISMNGDKYTLTPQYFTRTRPVQTSAYTRIREYWDVYTIPLRLLWKSAPAALTQLGLENPQQATSMGDWVKVTKGLPSMPLKDLGNVLLRLNHMSTNPNPTANDVLSGSGAEFASVNQFGYSRGSLAFKLLSYLGYGNINFNREILFPNAQPNQQTVADFNWATTVPYGANFYSQRPLRNVMVNVLPLLAYNKIYQDFFRWDQWESPDPSSYNVDYYTGGTSPFYGTLPEPTADYWNSATMFDLRYCNYKKDLLMGVLPNSQFGDVSKVISSPVAQTGATVSFNIGDIRSTIADSDGQTIEPDQVPNSEYLYFIKNYYDSTRPLSSGEMVAINEELTKNVNLDDLRMQFTILQLRNQIAVQKWREITQSGSYDYVSQVEKHTGVKISKSLSNLAKWEGGFARNLDISEVVNTNLADADAEIKGKGVGSGSDHIEVYTPEVSVVMVIYHAEPVLDYVLDAPNPQLWATSVDDLPIPEFDNVGLESVSMLQMWNNKMLENALTDANTSEMLIGYQPRYHSWKTKMDTIRGAFTTNLSDRTWVAPFDIRSVIKRFTLRGFADLDNSNLDYVTTFKSAFNFNFFKIDPAILDDIFVKKSDSTFESDQLLINCNIDCKVVRNLSRDGIQY